MPGMTGPELAQQLHASRPDLKILYMSGYTNDMVLRHGVEHEGVAFLQKPITPDQLLRKVCAVLSGAN
jgi:two-component system cell cycle sensor histidine kinase/response regulator CckA